MGEFCHQLRRRGLMWIVTLQAVGGSERLALMRLDQIRILGVVAIKAQSRSVFRQVEFILSGQVGAGFVGDVAHFATQVERGVTATFLRNVHPLVVASQAEVLALST